MVDEEEERRLSRDPGREDAFCDVMTGVEFGFEFGFKFELEEGAAVVAGLVVAEEAEGGRAKEDED